MTPHAATLSLLDGAGLHSPVLEKMKHARESVWVATANVKAMLVELNGQYRPVVDLFAQLHARGVEVKLLHAELPSRPFRNAFDKHTALVKGGLGLRLCPRVHFKCVLVDRAWLYLGSANLTGAGLGAKHDDQRNFELGVVTEDFELIDRTAALFESVWEGTPCATCRLHSECPDPVGPGPQKKKRKKKSRGPVGIELGRSRRFRR